jgi:krueppel-like factor 5
MYKQIKREPVAIFSHQSQWTPPLAPTQSLSEFTNIFSSHQTTASQEVDNIFIKKELPIPDLHLSVLSQKATCMCYLIHWILACPV